jgi:ABC-2 type transport system ATP-binding protein
MTAECPPAGVQNNSKRSWEQMIEVSHLTKRYGRNTALSDMSFTVEGSGVVGFLGPNGAGKSTTMNILTGYLSATSGTVSIEGHDVLDDADAAKSCIGYLPELPPLYMDMTVEEYLDFIYDLKKVKRSKKEHIGKICRLTGIDHVYTRLIGNLSKGYRQRVGLAQALLGDPPVLILDEPTVGLDPKQIIEIRNLVKTLGKSHTVILSSHILQEVEATCGRILIINNGRLAADGTQEELAKSVEPQRLMTEIEAPEKEAKKALQALPHVETVRAEGESEPGVQKYSLDESDDVRREVFQLCCDKHWPMLAMSPRRNTLEDIFLRVTSGADKQAEKEDADHSRRMRAAAADVVDCRVPETNDELSRKEEKAAEKADDADTRKGEN